MHSKTHSKSQVSGNALHFRDKPQLRLLGSAIRVFRRYRIATDIAYIRYTCTSAQLLVEEANERAKKPWNRRLLDQSCIPREPSNKRTDRTTLSGVSIIQAPISCSQHA